MNDPYEAKRRELLEGGRQALRDDPVAQQELADFDAEMQRRTSERVRSVDLRAGTILVHRDGHRVALRCRKDPEAHNPRDGLFHPGWWIVGHGGLADFVIDAEDSLWSPLPCPTCGGAGVVIGPWEAT